MEGGGEGKQATCGFGKANRQSSSPQTLTSCGFFLLILCHHSNFPMRLERLMGISRVGKSAKRYHLTCSIMKLYVGARV